MSRSVPVLSLLVALVLGGCSFRKPSGQPAAPAVAAAQSPARPVAPQQIGRVVVVNRALGFVLLDSPRAFHLPPSTELRAGESGPEGGLLRLSPERRRPYAAADIVEGAVAEGDPVFLVPAEGAAAAPGEQAETTGSASAGAAPADAASH